MIFVDTNFFLRFLLADNKGQFQEVKSLFSQAAEGRVKLFTSIIVYFEIYWVLSSFYKQNKPDTASTLEQILEMEFIFLEEHEILKTALKMFAGSNLSLEDCYNLAFAKSKKARSFKTFDKRLAKYFS
ncbi:MAG TPA: PIN domain-containing protein [Candidatus Nanoarchaeia archaeon]|nr:hypothetical protein [uncultured archaeon]